MMLKQKEHNYILIMAGGAGTRLYPRSTEDLPKQFQKIVGEKTLIEQTYDRAIQIAHPSHIYISSNHKYVHLIKKYLPKIPKENYITEPVKKNTGPAIALATAMICKKDPKAIIVSLHSDHLVVKNEEFRKSIIAGIHAVQKNPEYILCIGITPTSPHTGFGYIEKSKKFGVEDEYGIYKAKRFVEKPNLEIAKKYLASGNFFWNAGYFVWQGKHFLSELKKFGPEIHKGVLKIVKNQNTKNFTTILDKEFSSFKEIAIDNLIMEKTKDLLVLPVDIGWSDVGSWDVVVGMVSHQLKDLNGNYTEGTAIHVDTHNTTVLSHDHTRVIATIGLDNFIVITTEEAIVIVPKGRSEDVKKIVEKLKK
ncbi:MAG: sugar phosphate nucleotidyltransferase [Patescibacteria group bacterium]